MTNQADAAIHYSSLDSPIGPLLLLGARGVLRQIRFPVAGRRHPVDAGWREDRTALRGVREQLEQYFAGDRMQFDLDFERDLDLIGTPFQLRVWRELTHIPYGETISYGELARRIGNPRASRAVGAANGRNPIPIIVPCHRVVGSDGTLTGFGGGLPAKRALLQLEGAHRGERLLFDDESGDAPRSRSSRDRTG